MKALRRIILLVLESMIPIFLYEIAVIAYWLGIVPFESWEHIHYISWNMDLPILLALYAIIYFGSGIWFFFIQGHWKDDEYYNP